MKKFTERSGLNLSDLNKEMLALWQSENLFSQSLALRAGAPSFVFFEGPPSANGMPGIHHVMARTIKDLFCRYKTMQGFEVQRKAGWDTHGLPVELGVEKLLGITKEDVGTNISVADYNAHCRREVMKYTREWEQLTAQMGYWVDTTNPYITYDNRYIETVWWLLAQLYKKNLLYKGYTIQPYSPAAGTGLSSHELNQPGCYRDVKDLTATVLFDIVDPKEEMTGWGRPVFMAWTTTPWTLPSNTALCVGPKIDYVALRTYNPYTGEKITAVLAEALVPSYFKPEGAEADMDSYTAGEKVVPYRVVGRYTGPELVGMRYRQLLPWVKPCTKLDDLTPASMTAYAEAHPEKKFTVAGDDFAEVSELAFRVISGDYVTTDDGTGIVHIAPTFGADDAKVAKAADIPSLFMVNLRGETRPMVDLRGRFYTLDELAPEFVAACVDTEAYTPYAGEYVKNAYDPQFSPEGRYDEEAANKAEDLNLRLCLEMKRDGIAFRNEKHVHNYPHCWRTDKPVIYYPLDSWFIRSTAARDEMIALNNTIQWKPASTGSGRFGKWLENLQDWNLSRSRFWGTPLPIWRTDDASEEICIDSVETLYREIDRAVEAGLMASNPLKDRGFVPGTYTAANYDLIDLHRPFVDDIVLVSPSGKPMKRESDLIDVWFDSGAMPYAQIHYPFENKEAFDSGRLFPADFIAEGVDQTRGWFFTLHAIGTMVFGHNAFKAVISNGLVLDKNGEKMSKRKGNTVDPFKTIDEVGSDPLRWYMIVTSSPWDNLKYNPEGVEEVARKFFGTLANTYNFFAMYANVDGFDPAAPQVPVADRPEIDRWILSLLNTLVAGVTADFDNYEPTRAARAISKFVGDDLSNWYVRLNRKRFWGGTMDADKLAAYQTLHTCLMTVAKLMAPISPFFADRLYRDLAVDGMPASVHLSDFPKADNTLVDAALEQRMDLAQRLTSLVLALRKKANIKVRQPLEKILVPAGAADASVLEAIAPIVTTEVNVKSLEVADADSEVFVKRVQPDFKKLGPKFGKLMKAAAERIKGLSRSEISALEGQGWLDIDVDGTTKRIELDDVKIISEDIEGWLVANEGDLTVALDIYISPEHFLEGLAREIINRVQRLRKERGYDITDHITLTLLPGDHIAEVVEAYGDYIASQVLADKITVGDPADASAVVIFDIDALKVGAEVNLVKKAPAPAPTRYSDEELEEFRAIILAKIERATELYNELCSLIRNDGNDTADTSPTFKVLEEGANTLEREATARMAQRQLQFINHLQAALTRIDNKTYGICRATGKLIPKERLRAVPHATLCIEEKNNNPQH